MHLKTLLAKDFKCFEKLNLTFSNQRGLILITGENFQNSSMGANGIGKTTTFDIICWCLYGKTARGLKAGKLLRQNAKGGYSAKVEFDTFTVQRSWNPNSLKLNGAEAHQEEIDSQVGLTFDQFLLTTYTQQSGSQFLDLTAGEKLNFLSTIFDLEKWSKCSDKAKEKLKLEKDTLAQFEHEHRYLEKEKSSLEESINQLTEWSAKWVEDETKRSQRLNLELIELKEKQDTWECQQDQEICDERFRAQAWEDSYQMKIKTLQEEQSNLKAQLKEINLEPTKADLTWVRDNIKKLEQELDSSNPFNGEIQVLESKIKELEKKRDSTETKCPTCEQDIPIQQAANLMQTLDYQVAEVQVELKQKLEEQQKKQETRDSVKELLKNLKIQETLTLDKLNDLKIQQHEQVGIQKQIERLQTEIETKVENPHSELERTENPYTEQIANKAKEIKEVPTNQYLAQIKQVKESIKKKDSELTETLEKNKVVQEKISQVEFWVRKFPQVRLAILDEIILELEVHFNQALSSLGLQEWRVECSTERELKNENTKKELNLKIFRDNQEIELDVLSGGEKQRFRLASAIGLSDMIKNRMGVNFSLLMLDEPSVSLSREGTEQMLEHLKELSKHSLILLADHKIEAYAEFDQIWKIYKNESGISQLELESSMIKV